MVVDCSRLLIVDVGDEKGQGQGRCQQFKNSNDDNQKKRGYAIALFWSLLTSKAVVDLTGRITFSRSGKVSLNTVKQ